MSWACCSPSTPGSSGCTACARPCPPSGVSAPRGRRTSLWAIARLPRERLPLRSAVRPALLAAAGFEVIERGGAVYLGWVTGSPAGLVFGPVLGLLVAIYLGARLVLFATAWAATRRPAPAPDGDDAAALPEGVASAG